MNKLLRMTLLTTALSLPMAAQADWSIAALSNFDTFRSAPFGINDSGQVVGIAFGKGPTHGFITGSNGVGVTDLLALSNIEQAFDINNSGQVVGTTNGHSMMTGANGVGAIDLGNFGGVSGSYAVAINNSGQVVAQYTAQGGLIHTIITGPNGVGFTDIGTLGGRNNLVADINSSGQVTGMSDLSGNSLKHAYITGANGLGLTDLGSLNLSSTGTGINDSGQVVGSMDISDGSNHAYVTGPNGVNIIDLGTFGGRLSVSTAINNLGEVIGTATTAGNVETHSFLYSHGGLTDLNLLAPVVSGGWTNLEVTDINNNGQIVGSGIHNGVNSGFILSYTADTIFDPNPIFIPQVPEPETYAMLLAGLGMIGFMARRRKQNS